MFTAGFIPLSRKRYKVTSVVRQHCALLRSSKGKYIFIGNAMLSSVDYVQDVITGLHQNGSQTLPHMFIQEQFGQWMSHSACPVIRE